MLRQLLIIIAALGLNFELHAQISAGNVSRRNVDTLYVQLFGGLNKSANENMPWTEFSRHPFSGGAFLGLGSEFKPLWGWRAVLGIDGNKSRNVPLCESSQTWGWTDIEGWADVTFDITDAIRRLPEEHPGRFNAKLFAGIGGLYTFGFPADIALSYSAPYSRNSMLNMGLRAGMTVTYRISDKWRIGAELSHLFAADQFNGVNDNIGMDARTNLKVGISYTFRSMKKKPRPNAGVIMANRLKDAPLIPLHGFVPEGTKERRIEGRSFLDFPVNETVIRPAYRRNPVELKRIHETVERAMFDNSVEITGIQLHGYASPESPYANNTRLANGRVNELARHLQQHFKLSQSLFTLQATPEDWDNLRTFLEDNTDGNQSTGGARRTVKQSVWYNNDNVIETPEMPASVLRYRKELLQVINSALEPDAREEALKQVGNGVPYRWLLANVYPGLRHTDYVITYVAREYSVAEGRKLIYTHPEAMSLEEMYKVASSCRRGSADWYEAIIIAARQYPDDEHACYNAAIASMETHRLKDARMYLENLKGEDARYLRDVITAMEGSAPWHLENGKIVITGQY